MKKVVLAFAIAVAGIFISCSSPTKIEDGTLWGTGIYEGIAVCPITFVTINFTKGSVELGRKNDGTPIFNGLILDEKSTPDIMWASVTHFAGNSYFLRFAFDYKNNRGCRGRWVVFSENYVESPGSPIEFALIKIK